MSERARRRAESVRRALRDWDETTGGREPSAAQVARMRAAVMTAAQGADGDREAREEAGGSPRPRSWLPWAGWAVAAAAALLALAIGWSAARRGDDRPASLPATANASAEALPTEATGAPPAARERDVETPARSEQPDRVAGPDRLAAVSPRAPRAEAVAAPAASPEEATTADSHSRVAAAGSSEPPRRVRRLDFETPSGRKIHWVLDSDFRGVGGR
jgi:hypothetical protein